MFVASYQTGGTILHFLLRRRTANASSYHHYITCDDCVEGLAVGVLSVILLSTMFVLCLIYFRRRYTTHYMSCCVLLFHSIAVHAAEYLSPMKVWTPKAPSPCNMGRGLWEFILSLGINIQRRSVGYRLPGWAAILLSPCREMREAPLITHIFVIFCRCHSIFAPLSDFRPGRSAPFPHRYTTVVVDIYRREIIHGM